MKREMNNCPEQQSRVSRKRTRNESACGCSSVMRTVQRTAVLFAVAMLQVEGFVVLQTKPHTTRILLAKPAAVLAERPQPIQVSKTRKARPSSPLVNEQLLESLGDQFVTLTEPTLKPATTEQLQHHVAPSSSEDDASSTLRVTTVQTPRKTSATNRSAASPGRKTPEFTSLKTRRRPKRSKQNGSAPRRFNLSDGSNVSEYYFTKLLTRDEEYALGTKVQFLCRCHRVHEGLSLQLNRVPTIVEWAQACGFVVEDDPQQPIVSDEEELRPTGYQDMFTEVDPDEFVGNGLAADAGPGRGRGRRKSPPPTSLGDVYDDSEYQAQKRLRAKDRSLPKPSKPTEPINRGTPSQFVALLEEARLAKQQMMQTNMRLVVSIANKYRTGGVSFQDLVQEGSLGLNRAAEKFDPRKGFKFSTYASWWIQQAIFRCNAYHSRTIRLPVHIHNLLHKIRRSRYYLRDTLGRAPTNEEMAAHLGLPVKKFTKILGLTKQSLSLDISAYTHNPKDFGHESEDILIDTVAVESSAQQGVDRGLFREDLREMMEVLTESEKRVILMRYGLSDGMVQTVTAVAAKLMKSKAWVRSQECRALRKLRRPWYEKKMREHQEALLQ